MERQQLQQQATVYELNAVFLQAGCTEYGEVLEALDAPGLGVARAQLAAILGRLAPGTKSEAHTLCGDAAAWARMMRGNSEKDLSPCSPPKRTRE